MMQRRNAWVLLIVIADESVHSELHRIIVHEPTAV